MPDRFWLDHAVSATLLSQVMGVVETVTDDTFTFKTEDHPDFRWRGMDAPIQPWTRTFSLRHISEKPRSTVAPGVRLIYTVELRDSRDGARRQCSYFSVPS